MSLNTQQLKKHRWENRVLLIISENESSDLVKLQLELLNNPNELKERKLIIYRIHPKKYGLADATKTNWIKGSKLYNVHNSKKSKFKVVLIGLDGDIKLEQSKILNSEKLFSTIDRMPIRQRKLKDNRK